MPEQEKRAKVIKGLEQFITDFKPFCGNKADWQRVGDALALLKAQEPRTMTLEEAKTYLADDDQDKNPLWVQWATSSVKGGWVLPHTVEDLMWRYESIYQAHWVLWTQKPNDDQKKTVLWRR